MLAGLAAVENRRGDAPLPLAVEFLGSLTDAEGVWRDLEAGGVLSPYQRFDWVTEVVAAKQSAARVVVAVAKVGMKPVALLPLELDYTLGACRGRILGSGIGNSDWLIVASDAAAGVGDRALEVIARELRAAWGVDLLQFNNAPGAWQSFPNPLLRWPHHLSSDHLYLNALPKGDARLDAKRRSNLLRGKRRLEEQFGPVRLRHAESLDEVEEVHAVFRDQRTARFKRSGIENPFESTEFQLLFKNAAVHSLHRTVPTFRFYALFAGDEIVATALGIYSGKHYSQYINSTSDGPASKYSLMGILMLELTCEFVSEGINTFDLGVGNFDYKLDWSDPVDVFDILVPLSSRGKVAAAFISKMQAAKRAIKTNTLLWPLAKRARAYRHAIFSRLVKAA